MFLFRLETIHIVVFIHSGTVLNSFSWISRIITTRKYRNTLTVSCDENNEIYGYVILHQQKIFKGLAFSKKSDIYSMSMELTTRL